MAKILCIDTATEVCSVTLQDDESVLASEISFKKNSHAELISTFTETVLTAAGIAFKNLDAVAISKGPGSYTGLRIGTSYAKGLCYSLNIPLISFSTLQSLALTAIHTNKIQENSTLIPMIDARRMEAYYALFDQNGNFLQKEAAIIGDEFMFSELNGKSVYYFGSGAEKFQTALNRPGFIFIPQIEIDNRYCASLISTKFANSEFEDTAYFEPFYLKEFYSTHPKH